MKDAKGRRSQGEVTSDYRGMVRGGKKGTRQSSYCYNNKRNPYIIKGTLPRTRYEWESVNYRVVAWKELGEKKIRPTTINRDGDVLYSIELCSLLMKFSLWATKNNLKEL